MTDGIAPVPTKVVARTVSPDTISYAPIRDPLVVRVQTKFAWIDSWSTQEYLRPIRHIEADIHGSTFAELAYIFGSDVKRADVTSWGSPIIALDPALSYYVRIQILLSGSWETTFVGIIPRHSFNVESIRESIRNPTGLEYLTGKQLITARGLDWILEHTSIDGAWLDTGASAADHIDTDLTFNRLVGRGRRLDGNKSSTERNSPYTGDPAPVFGGSELWTFLDIARYLVEFRNCGTGPGPKFEIDGLTDNLDQMIGVVDRRGDNLLDLLRRLIDKRRGLTATIIPPEDPVTERVAIKVTSEFSQALVVDDITMDPNPDRVIVNLLNPAVRGAVRANFTIDRSHRIDTVRVRGAPLLSMFTLGYLEGTLVSGWQASETVDYLAAVSIDDADLNDRFRKRDRFLRVFQAFTVPSDWDFLVGNGGSGVGTVYRTTAPEFDANGRPVDEVDGSPVVALGQVPEHQFERNLLLIDGDDVDAAFGEYQSPIVLAKDPDEAFYYIDKPPDGVDGAAVRMIDGEPGIEVRPRKINHIFAGSAWDGSQNPSAHESVGDWQQFRATVAMRMDVRPTVEVLIPLATDTETILTIDVPDAESWWIVKGTVIGLTEDLALIRANSSTIEGEVYSQGILVRDDSSKLRKVAALAKAWYSQERAACRLTFPGTIDFRYPLGTMIEKLIRDWQSTEIRTVVSRRLVDYEKRTLTVETSHANLDFGRFV